MSSNRKLPWKWIAAFSVLVLAWLVFEFSWIVGPVFADEHHATHEEARDSGLFERGWLPAIIPTSAREIELRNNVDINTSEGEFRFEPSDAPAFVHEIFLGHDGRAKLGEPSEIDELKSRGYIDYDFSNNGRCWRFAIHPEEGHCHFWMSQVFYPPSAAPAQTDDDQRRAERSRADSVRAAAGRSVDHIR